MSASSPTYIIPRLAEFECFFDEKNIDVVQVADAEIGGVISLATKLIADGETEVKVSVLPPVDGVLGVVCSYLRRHGLQQGGQESQGGALGCIGDSGVDFATFQRGDHILMTLRSWQGSAVPMHVASSCGGCGSCGRGIARLGLWVNGSKNGGSVFAGGPNINADG